MTFFVYKYLLEAYFFSLNPAVLPISHVFLNYTAI